MEKLKNNISQTPCALPETDAFTKELADHVYKIIAPVIRSEIKSAVGATDITINHEHTHRHHSIAGFWNTGTAPRLYAKESVKTRLSFMKEKSSPVLKRVSLKRTRRWGSDSFKSLELVSLAALLCSPLKQPSSSL